MNIRLHAFEPCSRANGPGRRAVVWFQGCTLSCPGCFNPATHDLTSGYAYDTDQLCSDILAVGENIEGVSLVVSPCNNLKRCSIYCKDLLPHR